MNPDDNGILVEDRIKGLCWRTADGRLVPVSDMGDSHLRNTALFLMGMGYTVCMCNNVQRVAWLTILRKEWERRALSRDKVKTTFSKTKRLEEGNDTLKRC